MSFILSLVNAQCLLTLFVRIIILTCHIAPQLTLTVVGQCGSWANALKRCLGCCNDDQTKLMHVVLSTSLAGMRRS